MENKKVKFPTFTQAQALKTIFGPHSKVIDPMDSDTPSYLNNGRFVFAWDSDNPADGYIHIGALRSVTALPHGQAKFGVWLDGGYDCTFNHVALIYTEELPLVVCGGEGFCVPKCVAHYIGLFENPNGDIVCALERRSCDGYGIHFAEPKNVAFHSDINFGIEVKEAN